MNLLIILILMVMIPYHHIYKFVTFLQHLLVMFLQMEALYKKVQD